MKIPSYLSSYLSILVLSLLPSTSIAETFVASPGVEFRAMVKSGDTIRIFANRGSLSCQATPSDAESTLAFSSEVLGPDDGVASRVRFTGMLAPVVTGGENDEEGRTRVSMVVGRSGFYTLSIASSKDDAEEDAEIACYVTTKFAPYNTVPPRVRYAFLELLNFTTGPISGVVEVKNSNGELSATIPYRIPAGSPAGRTLHIGITEHLGTDFGVLRLISDAPLNAIQGAVSLRDENLVLVGPKRRFRLAPNNR